MSWAKRRDYETEDGTVFHPLNDDMIMDSAFDSELRPYWQIGNEWVPERALVEFVDALRAAGEHHANR